MNLPGVPADSAHPATGTLKLNIGNRVIDFSFPDSGNMRALVQAIFSGREYPLLRLAGYQPSVIVDVGANIGASAVFFHLAYPEARVYCYEPSAANVAFLQRNTQFTDRIRTFAFGLLDRQAELKLFAGKMHGMQSSLLKSVETAESFEMAQMRPAGREFDERGLSAISILKLDTEGSEVPILRDLGKRLSAIDFLYVEYHSDDDRRTIDRLLEADFIMAGAHSLATHRGTSIYVSRRIMQRFPALDANRIGPPGEG